MAAPSIARDEDEASTANRILDQSLQLFYAKGYSGTSIRDIASASNIAISTIFHHYASKASILESLLEYIVADLEQKLVPALEGIEDPRERLDTAVRVLVRQHCEQKVESFVAQSELRGLGGETQVRIRERRARLQRLFYDIVAAGVREGSFDVEDPQTSALAIVTMCTSVASWFEPSGPLSAADVEDRYVTFALRIVGVAA
jgi:AcrR family transcriptional regulator